MERKRVKRYLHFRVETNKPLFFHLICFSRSPTLFLRLPYCIVSSELKITLLLNNNKVVKVEAERPYEGQRMTLDAVALAS